MYMAKLKLFYIRGIVLMQVHVYKNNTFSFRILKRYLDKLFDKDHPGQSGFKFMFRI